MKNTIKKGVEVVVLSGSDKGKRGKILLVEPKKSRVIVEGVNMRKHHERKSEKNPDGAIVERESSIHISNVMSAERYDSKKKSK
ncbi:MAG: 50S ribosomal protein L24 [Opitutales bacterium]|nr:50S ribosomal protein L24 [Opitutales bacterium]